jgi:hypothetical protein
MVKSTIDDTHGSWAGVVPSSGSSGMVNNNHHVAGKDMCGGESDIFRKCSGASLEKFRTGLGDSPENSGRIGAKYLDFLEFRRFHAQNGHYPGPKLLTPGIFREFPEVDPERSRSELPEDTTLVVGPTSRGEFP